MTEKCDCESHAPPGFLYHSTNKEGYKWKCPNCGKLWVFIEDEAEGSGWYPADIVLNDKQVG